MQSIDSASTGVSREDRRATAKRLGARGVLYTTATFFALFAALPFAWMVFTIFKQDTDLYNAQNNPFSTMIRTTHQYPRTV